MSTEGKDLQTIIQILNNTKDALGWKDRPGLVEILAKAGSSDPYVAISAIEDLQHRWHLQPERDAKNAPTVDLMELLESYPELDRVFIVSTLHYLQLTDGCNGGCNFCLFGLKKGVNAKFSYESIIEFIDTYHLYLTKDFSFYLDSDPFDWRDEQGHSFKDVYRELRRFRPSDYHFVSTALPVGSEMEFIDFLEYAINELKNSIKEGRDFQLMIRLSLAKHNFNRVEVVINSLQTVLAQRGFTPTEIDDFFKNHFRIEGRYENQLTQVGPLIINNDPMRAVLTPASSDGSLITPTGVNSIAMTAATVYEPSGQKTVMVRDRDQIIKKLNRGYYSGFAYPGAMQNRIHSKKLILPPITHFSGEKIVMENDFENSILELGRSCLALNMLLEDFSNFYTHPNNKDAIYREKLWYVVRTQEAFYERRVEIMAEIEKAEELKSRAEINDDLKKQLDFYISLAKAFLAKLDFIMNLITYSFDLRIIASVATIFMQIGRNQLENLTIIVSELISLFEDIKEKKSPKENIEQELINSVGKYFGLSNSSQLIMPWWFSNIVEMLSQNFSLLNSKNDIIVEEAPVFNPVDFGPIRMSFPDGTEKESLDDTLDPNCSSFRILKNPGIIFKIIIINNERFVYEGFSNFWCSYVKEKTVNT